MTGCPPNVVSVKDDRCHAAYWLGHFPNSRLNAITPIALDQAKHDLTAKGLAPQTVMHYMKFLLHVINIAVRDWKLDRNAMLR